MSFLRARDTPYAPSASEILMNEFKKSVKQKIVNSIKDLQIEYAEKGCYSVTVCNNELSNQLVCGLEAMFVHGMKGSFIGKLSSAVFGGTLTGATPNASSINSSGSSSKLPEPNFWMYVLVFSHRDTIQRIEKLQQITTDIGRGRSWIRLALNDGLLGAYLQAIQKDRITSQKFYHRYSFIRDIELMDIITKYVIGIEQYKFDLALNSSMLNRWQTTPLILAGLWTPNVIQPKALPVTQVAVEAAEAIEEEGLDPLAEMGTDKFNTGPGGMQYLSRGLLNEDEALKIILGKHSLGGSGSSSAVETPIGSPKSIAVRVFPKNNGVRKALKSSHRQSMTRDIPSGDSSPKSDSYLSEDSKAKTFTTAPLPVSSFYGESKETDCSDISNKEDLDSVSSHEQPVPKTNDAEKSDNEEESIYSSSYLTKLADLEKEREACAHWNLPSASPALVSPSTDEDKVESIGDCSEKLSDANIIHHNNNHIEEILDEKGEFEVLTNNDVQQALKSRYKGSKGTKGNSSTSSRDSRASGTINLAIPSLAGFIDSWFPFGNGRFFDTPPNQTDDEKYGFTLKPEVRIGALNEADSQALMHLFDQVVREAGLDAQEYKCHDCSKAIGSLFGAAKVCAYTKKYYCDECHIDETSLIPAKIVFNWNFQSYKVSRKSKIFLDQINVEPIIDVKSFNSLLFQFANDLNEVAKLRSQLKYMNAYLTTCAGRGNKTKEAFLRLICPRSYIHESVDMYSIKDLEDIKSGKLKSLLGQASRICREHIFTCVLCQGKGFICELCRDNKPIYPFDLDGIGQCPKCFTVFHRDCSINLVNCPKCDRIEARNLNWHVNEARSARELGMDGDEDKFPLECS